MIKIIVFLLFSVFSFFFSNNEEKIKDNQYKTIFEDVTISYKEWFIREKTLKVDEEISIFFKTNTLSSWYCNWWEIFVEKVATSTLKKIFAHKKYCALDLENLSDSKIKISICYGDWGWSWECVFRNMIYNVTNNTWRASKNLWYYSPENIDKYELDSLAYKDEVLEKFMKYFKETYNLN